jgi:hypothetical protein
LDFFGHAIPFPRCLAIMCYNDEERLNQEVDSLTIVLAAAGLTPGGGFSIVGLLYYAFFAPPLSNTSKSLIVTFRVLHSFDNVSSLICTGSPHKTLMPFFDMPVIRAASRWLISRSCRISASLKRMVVVCFFIVFQG